MFEHFNVNGLYVAEQPVLSMYSVGRVSGTVLDLGHGRCGVCSIVSEFTPVISEFTPVLSEFTPIVSEFILINSEFIPISSEFPSSLNSPISLSSPRLSLNSSQ
jgi:hypothetical protein